MYVKVDGNPPSLFEIPAGMNSLDYGTHIVRSEPWKDIDWQRELGREFGFLHYRGSEIPPFNPPREPTGEIFQPYWIVHWAYWTAEPDGRSLGVVTTDPIYILNNNGKTIESLRHG